MSNVQPIHVWAIKQITTNLHHIRDGLVIESCKLSFRFNTYKSLNCIGRCWKQHFDINNCTYRKRACTMHNFCRYKLTKLRPKRGTQLMIQSHSSTQTWPCVESLTYIDLPSKHKTFVYHLCNVGPTSKTLGRRCINVMQMFFACWVILFSW